MATNVNIQVVKADDEDPFSSVRQGAGQLWKIGIDVDTQRQMFVPVETQLQYSTVIKNQKKRLLAIPKGFKNKHPYLPQKKKAKVKPARELGFRHVLREKDHIKEYAKLKKDVQCYVSQRNEYLCAKKNYDVARQKMNRLMGIFTIEELEQWEQSIQGLENMIKNANEKEQEFSAEKSSKENQLQLSENSITVLKAKVEEVKLDPIQLPSKQQQLRECRRYHCNLKNQLLAIISNLNTVKQAKQVLEKRLKKSKEKYEKHKKIRCEYIGKNDVLEAQQALADCRQRKKYFEDRLEQNKKNLKAVTNVLMKGGADETTTGGLLGGAFEYLSKQGMNNQQLFTDTELQKNVKQMQEITGKYETLAKQESKKLAESSKTQLEEEQVHLESMIEEAEKDIATATKRLEKLKKENLSIPIPPILPSSKYINELSGDESFESQLRAAKSNLKKQPLLQKEESKNLEDSPWKNVSINDDLTVFGQKIAENTGSIAAVDFTFIKDENPEINVEIPDLKFECWYKFGIKKNKKLSDGFEIFQFEEKSFCLEFQKSYLKYIYIGKPSKQSRPLPFGNCLQVTITNDENQENDIRMVEIENFDSKIRIKILTQTNIRPLSDSNKAVIKLLKNLKKSSTPEQIEQQTFWKKYKPSIVDTAFGLGIAALYAYIASYQFGGGGDFIAIGGGSFNPRMAYISMDDQVKKLQLYAGQNDRYKLARGHVDAMVIGGRITKAIQENQQENGFSGGGNDLAELQNHVKSYKNSLVQALQGSHRSILGGKLADQLVLGYIQ